MEESEKRDLSLSVSNYLDEELEKVKKGEVSPGFFLSLHDEGIIYAKDEGFEFNYDLTQKLDQLNDAFPRHLMDEAQEGFEFEARLFEGGHSRLAKAIEEYRSFCNEFEVSYNTKAVKDAQRRGLENLFPCMEIVVNQGWFFEDEVSRRNHSKLPLSLYDLIHEYESSSSELNAEIDTQKLNEFKLQLFPKLLERVEKVPLNSHHYGIESPKTKVDVLHQYFTLRASFDTTDREKELYSQFRALIDQTNTSYNELVDERNAELNQAGDITQKELITNKFDDLCSEVTSKLSSQVTGISRELRKLYNT